MGFEYDKGVRAGRQQAEAEFNGRLQGIRLGLALQAAAAMHLPAPAPAGAVESLERGLYSLRLARPDLTWNADPPYGSTQARSRQWGYTLTHNYTSSTGEQGWYCVVDLYNLSITGTGVRSHRFVSGVHLHALAAFAEATSDTAAYLEGLREELEAEQRGSAKEIK